MVAASGDTAALDRDVRLAVSRKFIDEEVPPAVDELAAQLGTDAPAIEASLRRLEDAHMLTLVPGTSSVWMAFPFSAIPTPFEVRVGHRRYFANCIWDALGIPVCLDADATIDSSCPDCSEPLRLEVRNGSLVPAEGVIHFAVPAARWWEDIGAT
jgi:alkylmercury lyase-like protein